VARLLSSRSDFDAELGALLQQGGAHPGALLVAEIDDWNGIASLRGSGATSAASIALTRFISALLRTPDLLLEEPEGRVMIFLPAATAEEGRQVAERLSAALRLHPFQDRDRMAPLRITISIGVAAAPDHGTSASGIYNAANAACLRVTSQGGDGAAIAPLPHHELLHRPLSINRFAGRAAEFRSLLDLLDDSVQGRPRVVAIAGTTGIGTSTLARQLEPEVRARGGAFVLASSYESDLPVPYADWTSLVRSLNRLIDVPKQEWHELQHLIPELGSVDQGQSGSQFRLLQELTAFIRSAAKIRPLLLVLDEMQWADPTSWDALEHVMGALDHDRVMICFTVRTERQFAEVADRRRALTRFDAYQSMELSALTRDEVKQWIEGAFHRQPVGRDFLAFLYRQTEGNPQLISQLLRLLLEEGALWHTGERWEWSPVSELRVPSGAAAIIAHRLARFSSSTQTVLTTAATIGAEFDIPTIVGARAGSEAAVRPAVAEALAANFLRASYDRRRGAYVFNHVRIVAALVESVPRDRLKEVHGRVAAALVARGDRPSAEIAGHYDRAGMASEAYEYALLGATEAERVYAYAAATLYLKLAARSASNPGELAQARLRLAHLAEIGGRFDEVEELCDLAIEWFDGQGDTRQTLSLRRLRQAARMAQGQPAKVTYDALRALDEEAQRLGLDRERVAILTLMSESLSRMGDRRTAQQAATECVEMAERLDDSPLLADALARLGRLLMHEAPGRAQAVLQRALELFERLADIRGQAKCYNNLAVVAQFENRVDDAVEAYSVASSFARVAGIPDIAGAAAVNLGIAMMRKGNHDRARDLFAEAIAAFAAVQNSEFQLVALFNMGDCELSAGNWNAAHELYSVTIPLAQRIGHSDIEIGAIAGQGLCLLAMSKIDEARRCSETVTARVASRPDWFQGREFVEALRIRLAATDNRGDEALRRFSEVIEMTEASEPWVGVWMISECAEILLPFDPRGIHAIIERFTAEVGKLGNPIMTERYAALIAR
jgi:GGDEF domain-containing protein/tetratricopeptide (TPR) repeat protein